MAEVSEVSDQGWSGFLLMLAAISNRLREFGLDLRGHTNVLNVDRRTDINYGHDRASVEWYVDADLASGEVLSCRLLLVWQEGEWVIESDVRRVAEAGSDEEIGLPTRFATDEDLETELKSAAFSLVSGAEKHLER